ncbi:MAG: mandelate racemase/muconate lactonizing enzyme family protein [Pseudomonadota bacterium]
MARIEGIETGFYRIPLPRPVEDARHGVQAGFEIVTVRVRDADGAEGTGYTFTNNRGGAAIAACMEAEVTPVALGQDADAIEALWQKLWWAMHYGGRGGAQVMALSAFDIALWDLKAVRAGLPLWRLLGGFDPLVPAYAGGIDLDLTPEALVAQTEANIAKGFRAVKMKVGRDVLAEDVAKLAAMREAFGDAFPLMIDANMKYSVDGAVRAARAFAPFAPLWFEEPIDTEDMPGHAIVRREGGLPLAAGENMRTLQDFRTLIANGVTFPEPDVTNCGGVTAFMKIAHLAEAHCLPVTSHGAHDITVHLLAAIPNRSYLEAHGFGLDAHIAHPVEIREGMAVAPDRPGHGMAFDWASLEALRA